jgi:hypothetical protein
MTRYSEEDKRIVENGRLYHRNWARNKRASEKKNNQIYNEEVKEKIIPAKELKVESEYPRQEYMKNYHRKKFGFHEPKIKNIKEYIEDIKKYPVDFPKEEFNKKLDKILEYFPSKVEDKELRDILYDILDKKGILTPGKIIRLYNDDCWTHTIESFMSERHYSKNGDDIFTLTKK